MDLEVEMLSHRVGAIYIIFWTINIYMNLFHLPVSHTIYTTNESKCNLLTCGMTSDREFYLVLEHRGAGAGGRAVRWGWVYLHWPLFFDFNVWCGRQRHVKRPCSSLLEERSEHSLNPWFPSTWICISKKFSPGSKCQTASQRNVKPRFYVQLWPNPFNFSGFCFPNYKMEITPVSPWVNT